jgi:hypothetical protein
MLDIIVPRAFVFGTVRIQKSALALPLSIHKSTIVGISQGILGHVDSSQIPVVLSESVLNAVLPLARVRLILIEPFHGSLAVPHIIHPHSLVHVARYVLAYAPTELAVIDPVAFVKRGSLAVVNYFTLFSIKI